MEGPADKREEPSKKVPAMSPSSGGRRGKEASVNAVNTAHQASQQYSMDLTTTPTAAPTYFPPPPPHQPQSIYYSTPPAPPTMTSQSYDPYASASAQSPQPRPPSLAAKDKGKAPTIEDEVTPESSPFPSKKVTEEEAEAFMKIVKSGPSRADRMIRKVLLRNNYIPGTSLGARGQGISRLVEIEEYKHRRGLGFRPSCHEIIEARLPEDSQVPEIEESLRRLEDHQITSIEPTEEINVGTEEEPRTLKIGTALNPTQRARMIDFLKEYQEVFAWSYADMPGLDPSIVEHFLPLDTEKFPPKRQQLRRQRASLLLRIKEEVVKQINAGFLKIWMAEKDKLKTTFTTMWGTFCYSIMPFGLKNAGATYQRAMVTLFHDMMHKEVEVYVDDMIAKSKEGEDHLVNLKRLFDRLKEYKLRLNPAKCTFGARSGKLLGFVVTMEWDHECQKAFNTIKAYLIQPPILVPPVPSRPLILYLTVRRQSLGCMLGQEDESTHTERAIYYLSKKFTEGESNYPEIEKMCCALELAKNFEKISFTYTPRAKNQFADALATLASMASISEGNVVEPLEIEVARRPAHCNAIEASEAKPWYEDIKNFLQTGHYPPFADRRDRNTLRRLAMHYFLSGEILYRRSFDSTLLRCIDEHESRCLMEEVHGGNCGPHMNGLMLAKKIMRLGYYWSTMETDCVKHVRHCHRCQVYADQIKAPPNELRPMTAPWPFSMWGMDVIGPINPKASNGHMFILVAIDYFTKWIEAVTLASVTTKAMVRFLRRDVIAQRIETPKVDGMGRVNETHTRTGSPFPSIDRGVSGSLAPRVPVNQGMTVMPLDDKIVMFMYKLEICVTRRSLRRILMPRLEPPQIGPGLESRHVSTR
ncbi:hypothetical protein CRG98_029808 [Punica granatum]|uniref:Uncharacterized protein n=1 Tax=Punica granatum TaxID=22663 RepID=A0A2I0J0N3_PUNGR|nr:hypothetical protein CRG98_029808 [Punica granatum]